MDKVTVIKNIAHEIIEKISNDKVKINVSQEENEISLNIESDNASSLIGHHGETIQAIQHIIKTVSWKKLPHEKFNILVDVDNYRKRQEETVLRNAQRKIDTARKTYKTQVLPPMSPYLRRKVHMLCTQPGYEDIETLSEGIGEKRHLVIKIK